MDNITVGESALKVVVGEKIAKTLQWRNVEPEVFHDKECYNADVEILMCNEKHAHYEVGRFKDSGCCYYQPSFYYGNQGGHLRYERYDTKEEAMQRCQEHYNSLVRENSDDQTLSTPLPDVEECVEWNKDEFKKQIVWDGYDCSEELVNQIMDDIIANSKAILKWKKVDNG